MRQRSQLLDACEKKGKKVSSDLVLGEVEDEKFGKILHSLEERGEFSH